MVSSLKILSSERAYSNTHIVELLCTGFKYFYTRPSCVVYHEIDAYLLRSTYVTTPTPGIRALTADIIYQPTRFFSRGGDLAK